MKRNKGKTVFNPPVRYPNKQVAMMQEIKKAYNADILKETNNTLNLVTSAYSIVLKEFFGFTDEQLKDALSKVMEQLELCADEIVTIDQMMDLCAEYGLEVTKTGDELDKIGTLMMLKVQIFELLDKGVTEVEDLAKQAKTTSRLASAFRWEWNKLKFGKDYGGDVIMASKKALAFQLFDKGIMDSNKVAEEIDSTKGSADVYKKDWKRDVLSMLTTEEAEPYFSGEKELWQIKAEKLKAQEENKKHYEAPKKDEVKKDDSLEKIPEVEKNEEGTSIDAGETDDKAEQAERKPAVVNPKFEAAVQDMTVNKPEKKKGLKKVVKVIEVEGEFATYRPLADNTLEIELAGQVISLSKNEMQTLISEFGEISGDEDLWQGGEQGDQR